MPVISAGILLHRRRGASVEIFLIHPGGPFWAKKDVGAWSVPKGLVDPNEDQLAAARREFKEETGFLASGPFRELGTFRQPSGKRLRVWAAEGDCDPAKLVSNEFEIEWPPRSGKRQKFPEADRGDWFNRADASTKIVKGQKPIIEKFYWEVVGRSQPSRRKSAS